MKPNTELLCKYGAIICVAWPVIVTVGLLGYLVVKDSIKSLKNKQNQKYSGR